MGEDQAKAIVLETCKSPLQMDIAQMKRGLEYWGFEIKEYELLSDGKPGVLQEYMVWLDCHYGIELARTNIANWLTGLKDFPWIGRWDYVVNYAKMGGLVVQRADFTVVVTRYSGGVFNVHGVDVKMPWPNRRRELIDETKWQRPYLYGQ